MYKCLFSIFIKVMPRKRLWLSVTCESLLWKPFDLDLRKGISRGFASSAVPQRKDSPRVITRSPRGRASQPGGHGEAWGAFRTERQLAGSSPSASPGLGAFPSATAWLLLLPLRGTSPPLSAARGEGSPSRGGALNGRDWQAARGRRQRSSRPIPR